MINENIAAGKWNEFKGRIRKAWGDISDDDLERAKGDVTTIAGMIRKKYGIAEEEARRKLNDLLGGSGESKGGHEPGQLRH